MNTDQGTLFEIGQETPPVLKQKNDVCHFELSCKSILNYCDTYHMPDCFTINPYRGCEFGCRYCYARYTHEFMELPWEEFEKKIFVKIAAPRVLMKTLDQKKLRGKHIAIGTATDPYQPAEAKFRITQRLLEVFAQAQGLSLSVTTKSALVKRDLPIFKRVSARNDFQVNISLISLDEELLHIMEPKASRPSARLQALKEMREAGIRAGIFLMPILPGITDSRENLESVIRAARENGALYVGSNLLFLRESSKKIFYNFLRERSPELYKKYQAIYGDRTHTLPGYRRRIGALVAKLKRQYGFPGSPTAE